MKTCVYPGSFDPVTGGHLDLITRASAMFDKVTVVVMINRSKKGLFPVEKRCELLRKACRDLPNVEISYWDGLLADYMKSHHENIVLRGIRNTADFENEYTAASANKLLYPDLETVILFAGDGKNAVSSSAVREIASFHGDFSGFVPVTVYEDIKQYIENEGGNQNGQ